MIYNLTRVLKKYIFYYDSLPYLQSSLQQKKGDKRLIILGIDPGLAIMGYGLIEEAAGRLKMLDYGAVYTEAGVPLPDRLNDIFDGLSALIDREKPDAVAFEELFFSKNVKTAIAVAQARGVAMAAAFKKDCALYEYTPLQVKQAITGYGRAEKLQMQSMVKVLLNLRDIPKPDDAADALALAICHAHSMRFQGAFRIK
jgi:crossover junction endodeoxyribonuclease RuvC